MFWGQVVFIAFNSNVGIGLRSIMASTMTSNLSPRSCWLEHRYFYPEQLGRGTAESTFISALKLCFDL
jgi:hypothetical protein